MNVPSSCAARLAHERLTVASIPRERVVADLFDASPALISHRVFLSSRNSHNFAIVQSRFTVRTDTPSASAVSSMLRPPK